MILNVNIHAGNVVLNAAAAPVFHGVNLAVDDQHRAENAAHGRDVKGVYEPLAIGIQAVYIVGKEVDEGLQAVFRREEAVNLVQAARFAQRSQNQPQAGEQKDQGNDGQRQIGEPIVHSAAQRQLLFSGIGRHGVCAH